MVKEFFKNAFKDMANSTKLQHEVDKAEFDAVKAEAKADFLEHKCNSSISKGKSKREMEYKKLINTCIKMEIEEKRIDALNRKAAAQERIDELKNNK